MDVLVIGGGGREHAICWGLNRSPQVGKIYCAPGNPGIAALAECVDMPLNDLEGLAKFAAAKGVGLTVVGPEAPLCDGLADVFRAKGLPVFGPSKAAAALEGSKDFSKLFMVRHGIPTAKHRTFDNAAEAEAYVKAEFAAGRRQVVKADGLAAGKGVIVAESAEEALKAVADCFGGAFGSAGAKVVVEEFLEGEEASILALCDGKSIVPLASSQDHKRLLDDDQGPNTGGMGAYSPAPVVDKALMDAVEEKVLKPFLKGVQADGLDYRGIIYAGIMATKDGPKVLEFNVRFGDPETQAVLTRLESDLADALLKTSLQRLSEVSLAWSKEPSVCVVMASGGYPGSYKKGLPISGVVGAEASGAIVFHAGTSLKDGVLVNSGGRVFGVTARGSDIKAAIANAYKGVRKISWEGAQFRSDIAAKALKKRS